MIKTVPARITYAQEKLLKLISERKLKSFALSNGLNHSILFGIAYGDRRPTYKLMASMSHLIPVIEWLFYTDEKLPYEPVLLPPNDLRGRMSRYIAAHQDDYEEQAEKYGLKKYSAENLFVRLITSPELGFMRKACDETDPADFFREAENAVEMEYVPVRGDIIKMSSKNYFVVSMEIPDSIVLCPVSNVHKGVEITGKKTKGYVLLEPFTVERRRRTYFVEKAGEKTTGAIMKGIRRIFE